MRVIDSVEDMQREAGRLRLAGKRIGLVPTMGFLHAGHASLLTEARKRSDSLVLSIFVNPTQFAPSEDFAKYPRDMDRDRNVAEEQGVDIIFCPEASAMYADGFSTFVGEQEASTILEGRFRPTHFRGVTTVVAKLFNICKPHLAVFGQKDAQQAFIIRKMIRDLNFDIDFIVAPIVREADGLAMSSRNVYLSNADRANATILYQSLKYAECEIQKGERSTVGLRTAMESMIRSKRATGIDYIAFIDPEQFREVETVNTPRVLAALAVRFGATRLIDNIVVDVKRHGGEGGPA